MAVCLAAVFSIYEFRRRRQRNPSEWVNIQSNHPVHNDKLAQQSSDGESSSSQVTEERPSTEEHSDANRQQSNNNCHNNNNNNNSTSNSNIWDMECYLAIIKTT